MNKLLKWAGLLLAVLVVAVGVLFAVAWWNSERAMARVYAVEDPPLPVLDPGVALERGAHLFLTRGCADCHAPDGGGAEVMDAGPVARVVGSNLTPARLDPAYDADAIAAAVRHGLRHDGTPLVFMPAWDWEDMGDEDMAALAAYVSSLPPVDRDPGATEVRPLGRVLHLFGAFPLLPAEAIDHAPRSRGTPDPAPTAEYGAYVARMCTGCHRPDFSGGLVHGPDAPPTSNLTPHADGMGDWSEADFFRAMREGRRPGGRELHPMMPWRNMGRMTDTELSAIWAYLRTLPPKPDPA